MCSVKHWVYSVNLIQTYTADRIFGCSWGYNCGDFDLYFDLLRTEEEKKKRASRWSDQASEILSEDDDYWRIWEQLRKHKSFNINSARSGSWEEGGEAKTGD